MIVNEDVLKFVTIVSLGLLPLLFVFGGEYVTAFYVYSESSW